MKKIIIILFIFFTIGNIKAENVIGDYLRSFIYTYKRDYQRAYEELKKVIKKDPSSSFLRLKLGLILFKLKKYAEAEKELEYAKKLDPDNLEISAILIFFYATRKEKEKLEKEYQFFLEKAHKLQPQNIKISEYLAQFYFYKKMPQEAIKIYQMIIKQKPDYADGYYWLGYLYEEMGERKKAIKMWEKTLELNPNHADALNSLGYIYAEEGIKLNEAEKLVKKALEKDPQNGAYLDSLGWVYFKKKEYKKAEVFLLKAIKFTKDPVIYEHLGDLYITLNNKEKALKFYKEGLKFFPQNLSLKKKVEKYESKNKGIEKNSQ